jgi:tetratricopeptide (TPR) repeat protein
MRRMWLFACALLLAALPGFTQITSDFSLVANPAVTIPLGPSLPDGTPFYTIGGGLSIKGEYTMPFARFLYAGVGLDVDLAPINMAQKAMTFLSLGPHLGVKLFPIPRLEVKVAGTGGMYVGFGVGGMTYNPFAGALVDISYLLNPSLSIGAGAAYKHNFSMYGPLYQGISANLGVSWHVGAGAGKAMLQIEPTLAPVFPLFFSYYDEHPAGNLVIKNTGSDAVQDVSASFFVKEFMEQPKVFYRAPALARGQEIQVPVFALFDRRIFDVTTETKVVGEIAVTHSYLGSESVDRKTVTVTINNRNSMTWDDDRKAAAFITSTDPDVMLFAKNIASDAGSKAKPPAINSNFRIAMALFQAMAVQGVGYVTDPTTPYGSALENAQAIDYLQFPMQTLAYRAGDCDDISILYCALLEAAGISTALITVPGHIYAAFDLGMRPEDARATFSYPERLIFRDNETWVPVEITLVRKGFTEAWRAGAVDWQTNNAKGAAKFLVVRDAWQEYRPVSASRVMKDPVKLPDPAVVFKEFTAEMGRYLAIDLTPRVLALQSDLRATRTVKLMNRLGVLYARYGMLAEARTQFEAAIKTAGGEASTALLINMGNVSYLNGNFKDASTYYNRALVKTPGTIAALRGLAMASYEAGDTKAVDAALVDLRKADPESADKLVALGSGEAASGSGRAASAEVELNTWSEE